MFCIITSSKLSCQQFEFSLKVEAVGSNPGYLLKLFLPYLGSFSPVKKAQSIKKSISGSKNYFFNRQKKMLKDIKSTLSASLKSIDVSIRSGSITSLSSGKSFVSNFSVKSDSGISLPAPKPMHVQELSNVQERPEIINLPPRLGT